MDLDDVKLCKGNMGFFTSFSPPPINWELPSHAAMALVSSSFQNYSLSVEV